MEPNDFDNLIREKAKEKSNLHAAEMDAAKLRIWEQIEEELPKKRGVIWWRYSIAAAFILLFGIGGILYQQQKSHYSNELNQLRAEISSMQEQENSKETFMALRTACARK